MRVGFFTEVYHPVVNGIVASVDALAAGLRRLGHDVYCFTPHVPGYEERDGPVYRIPSLPLPVQAPYRLTVPVVSRRNRRAVINRLHIVHAHSPFVTGWMAVRYARRLRLPLVYTYHTQLEEYAHYVPFEPNATRFAAVTLTRNFANSADAVIVPTGVMGERLRELGVTVPVEVIPSGIDLEHFAAGRRSEKVRSALGVRNGERMLFFVSRLAREKNAAVLIDALARCTVPARLVIAGDGPERQALEERAAQAGVTERTVFMGGVDREGLPNLYASADAFVFPSVTETQGLVLAEALAAGCYVIAANAQQNREVLAGAGALVDATPGAFAAAIEALPFPPRPAVSMVARSAAAAFGIERTVGRVLAVYEGLHARRADAGIH
ncbi:MAG TPA: glycosyltransferase [Candidatus Baltobacteraceae bacterium]|jgi:glycosyltransferase involved in cell wall biosynthesis|nr:glycosyltransferase [Candidatus Baltobacteraceae bacterium]